MRLSIRSRLLLWLLVATLPVMVASTVVISQVERGLAVRAARELETLAGVERDRIESALATIEADGQNLVEDRLLHLALEPTAEGPAALAVGFADVFLARRSSVGTQVEAIAVLSRSGAELQRSGDFSWTPYDPSIALQAMDERRTVFGNAFQTSSGQERVGLAVPVEAVDGSVLGAVLIEHQLMPILDLSLRLESAGQTIEAMVIQSRPDGTAEPITLRRFDRDAAFQPSVAAEDRTPSLLSLETDRLQTVEAQDYRNVDTLSAIDRINATGWGLVVKIDRAEAFGLSTVLRRFIFFANAVTALGLVVGWWTQVRPLGRRIARTAAATERIASGDYTSFISDHATDEIGTLARSIDRMAADLDADIRARHLAEQTLRHQATHDKLTGLINREHATEIIDSYEDDDGYALLFLDLDGFKEVNDTYGHAVGDELLVAIAGRLKEKLGAGAELARWGGDEFLAIQRTADLAQTTDLRRTLAACFDDPVVTSVGRHRIGASIGGASSRAGASMADVLVEADANMFKQKHRRTAYRKASPATLRLVGDALDEGRVEPFYQPVVRSVGERQFELKGAEALVRIRNVDGSLVQPGAFLPELGASELAKGIDTRVLECGLADLGRWLADEVVAPDFTLAFNFGPASIRDSGVIERLAQLMEEHAISGANVVIEIPETVETVDSETVDAFRQIGVGLAIDDVGCQYSNLERMIDIDADIAKLDRRWIPDLATATESTSVVLESLIGQCRTLSLALIAEGVETEAQLQMLLGLGVDTFQGYYFAQPLSCGDFELTWAQSANASSGDESARHEPTNELAR